jgi:hypothetical protein
MRIEVIAPRPLARLVATPSRCQLEFTASALLASYFRSPCATLTFRTNAAAVGLRAAPWKKVNAQ